MTSASRRAVPWAAAVAGALLVLWRGSTEVFWHDFGMEAWPAFEALVAGDLRGFLEASPIYAGSMTLRAPLAYLAGQLGADDNWIYRAGAVPSVAVVAWLAVALYGEARRRIRESWAPAVVLALVAAGPLVWLAFLYGHPEDVLAAGASVGAVLLALRGRTIAAGVLVGLAVAAKQWALLAVVPALLAAPRRDLRMLVPIVLVPAILVAPVLLADVGAFSQEARAVAGTGMQFHPHTVWWPFAVPGPALPGATEPAFVAPAWLSPLPKPLIVMVGLAVALWWARRRGTRPGSDVFLLLAVVFLLRCVLDPWNLSYYHLPFVLSLLAWEVHERRPPVLALAATAMVWLSFEGYTARSGVGPFALYLAWAGPLLAYMALRLAAGPGGLRVPWQVAGSRPSDRPTLPPCPDAATSGVPRSSRSISTS